MRKRIYKIILDPDPGKGFTVTCDKFPELITQGDTIEECLENFCDALMEVITNKRLMKISL